MGGELQYENNGFNQGGQRATLVSDSLEEPRAITLHPGKGSVTAFFINITFMSPVICDECGDHHDQRCQRDYQMDVLVGLGEGTKDRASWDGWIS